MISSLLILPCFCDHAELALGYHFDFMFGVVTCFLLLKFLFLLLQCNIHGSQLEFHYLLHLPSLFLDNIRGCVSCRGYKCWRVSSTGNFFCFFIIWATDLWYELRLFSCFFSSLTLWKVFVGLRIFHAAILLTAQMCSWHAPLNLAISCTK